MCKKENKDYLTEYQKAQDSAQHHDSIIWTATGVVWVGNIALFAFVFSIMQNLKSSTFLIILSALGILMTLSMLFLSLIRMKTLKQKYDRCIKLEECYGFEQNKNLKYRAGLQKISHIITTLAFIVAWLYIGANSNAMITHVKSDHIDKESYTKLRNKYTDMKTLYIELARSQINVLDVLINKSDLQKDFDSYKDLTQKEFEELIRRKLVKLELQIDQLRKENK